MSSTIRSIRRHANTFARAIYSATNIRSFHSPFAILGNSPLTSPPTSAVSSIYNHDFDPTFSSNCSLRTYVVSHDPSHAFYSVPSGAYPTSAPYVNFDPTEAPNTHEAQINSTSTTPLTHPQTTLAAPQHDRGVGESAAVRSAAAASGAVGGRGGAVV